MFWVLYHIQVLGAESIQSFVFMEKVTSQRRIKQDTGHILTRNTRKLTPWQGMSGKENRKVSCGFWIYGLGRLFWNHDIEVSLREWDSELWGTHRDECLPGLSEHQALSWKGSDLLWGSKEASVCWRSGREDEVRDALGADTLGSCRPSTCLWTPLWMTWGTWRGMSWGMMTWPTTGSVGGSWGHQMTTL